MSEYMTLEQVAERLGVDYKTVYRLVRSGELPAGKIGRIYRVRGEDLEAFFERQKGETAAQARRLVPAEDLRCASCGKRMLSALSVGGKCQDCGADICQACWAIKKIRYCEQHKAAEHSPAAPSIPMAPKKTKADAQSREGRTVEAAKVIADLRRAGKTVVTVAEARARAESFLRAFGQRIGQTEELPDSLSGLVVRLRKARVKHTAEGLDVAGVSGANSRFLLRVGGWGKPKGCLVLEARVIARDGRLNADGCDTEPIGKAELSGVLNRLASEAAKQQCFRVVQLGSLTGWADEAKDMLLRREGASFFRDRKVAVALCDLHAEETTIDETDERLWPFWPIVAPGRYAEALQACKTTVRDALAAQNSLSLAGAAKLAGADEYWVRDAFRQLSREEGYLTDEVPDVGLVISRKT